MVKKKNHNKEKEKPQKKRGRPRKENNYLTEHYKNRFSRKTNKKYFIENCVNKLITEYIINGMETDGNFQSVFGLYNSYCYKKKLAANKTKARLMIKIICFYPNLIKDIDKKIRQERASEEKIEEILELTYTGDRNSRAHNGLTLLDEIIKYIKAKSDKLYNRNEELKLLAQTTNDMFGISQDKTNQILVDILDKAFSEEKGNKASQDLKKTTAKGNKKKAVEGKKSKTEPSMLKKGGRKQPPGKVLSPNNPKLG